jgi:hypothetical protein
MTTKRVQPVGVYIELDRANWERLTELAKRAHTTPLGLTRYLTESCFGSTGQRNTIVEYLCWCTLRSHGIHGTLYIGR